MEFKNPTISIGLTGTLGSGKSTVSKLLQQKNCLIIDADRIAKNLYSLSRNKKKLIDQFGANCFDEKGRLNSKFLANTIFKNKENLKWLEALIHPQVKEFIKKYKNKYHNKGKILVFEVPLLFEVDLDKENLFDFIIVVDAPFSLRKKRVLENRNWTEEEFINREKRQMKGELKQQKAHFVIINQNSIEELKKNIEEILKQIRSEM